ncbi:MAG: M50 family metallopeptidase, partial [Tumebacillaceae bacterium]
MNIVMALLALGFLVFIHELGHYWAARASGIRVEEFAIGFGPPILKYKRNGIAYRLNWVPLGGYVRMLGEDNPEAASAPDNFNNRPIGARILVICAGVIMNLVGAFLILALLFNIYGLPTSKLMVGAVVPNSPALAAGFQANDELVSVNGIQLGDDYETFNKQVQAHEGKPMNVEVKRDNQIVPLTVTPRKLTDKVQVGIQIGEARTFVKQGGFAENTKRAFNDTGNMTVMMFDSFKKMVSGNVALKDIGGPVEIVRVTGEQAGAGVPYFMYIVALISINLAVINILPFPHKDDLCRHLQKRYGELFGSTFDFLFYDITSTYF